MSSPGSVQEQGGSMDDSFRSLVIDTENDPPKSPAKDQSSDNVSWEKAKTMENTDAAKNKKSSESPQAAGEHDMYGQITDEASASIIGPCECPICKHEISNIYMMILHLSTHWDISGASCSKISDMPGNLSVQYSSNMFTCNTCQVSTSSFLVFREHIRCHTVKFPYLCTMCDVNLTTLSSLRRHYVDSHPGQTPEFTMRVTQQMTDVLKQIVLLKKMSNNNPIEISGGKKSNPSPTKAKEKTKESPNAANANSQSAVSPQPPNSLYCEQCNSKFQAMEAYLFHLLQHTPFHVSTENWQNKTTFAYQNKVYNCTGCPYSAACRGAFIEHVRCHTVYRPYFCTICNESFGTVMQVRAHFGKHTGVRPQSIVSVKDSPILDNVMAQLGPAAPATRGTKTLDEKEKSRRAKKVKGPGADSQNPINLDDDEDVVVLDSPESDKDDSCMVVDFQQGHRKTDLNHKELPSPLSLTQSQTIPPVTANAGIDQTTLQSSNHIPQTPLLRPIVIEPIMDAPSHERPNVRPHNIMRNLLCITPTASTATPVTQQPNAQLSFITTSHMSQLQSKTPGTYLVPVQPVGNVIPLQSRAGSSRVTQATALSVAGSQIQQPTNTASAFNAYEKPMQNRGVETPTTTAPPPSITTIFTNALSGSHIAAANNRLPALDKLGSVQDQKSDMEKFSPQIRTNVPETSAPSVECTNSTPSTKSDPAKLEVEKKPNEADVPSSRTQEPKEVVGTTSLKQGDIGLHTSKNSSPKELDNIYQGTQDSLKSLLTSEGVKPSSGNICALMEGSEKHVIEEDKPKLNTGEETSEQSVPHIEKSAVETLNSSKPNIENGTAHSESGETKHEDMDTNEGHSDNAEPVGAYLEKSDSGSPDNEVPSPSSTNSPQMNSTQLGELRVEVNNGHEEQSEKVQSQFHLDFVNGSYTCKSCCNKPCGFTSKKLTPLRTHLFKKLHPTGKCLHCPPELKYNSVMNCAVVSEAINQLKKKENGKVDKAESMYLGYVQYVKDIPSSAKVMEECHKLKVPDNGKRVSPTVVPSLIKESVAPRKSATKKLPPKEPAPINSAPQQPTSELGQPEDDPSEVCQRLLGYDWTKHQKGRVHENLEELQQRPFSDDDFYKCRIKECQFSSDKRNHFILHMHVKHHREQSYTCQHCRQEGFADLQALMEHLAVHKGIYLCPIEGCEFASKEERDFETHCEQKHVDIKEYECYNCKTALTNGYKEYIEHITSNKMFHFKCLYCGMETTSRIELGRHLSAMHPGEQKKVKQVTLLSCKQVVPVRSPVYVGSTASENEHEPMDTAEAAKPVRSPTPACFKCALCGAEFPEQTDLANHLKACRIRSLNPSLQPPQQAPQPSTLPLSNSSPHSTLPPHRDEHSTSKSKKKAVARKSTGGGLFRMKPPTVPEIAPERQTCTQCDFVCHVSMHLTRHMTTHIEPQNKALTFQCKKCPYASDERAALKAHLRCHPGKHVMRTYKCPYCQFESCEEDVTEDHVDQQHPSEKCSYEVKRDVVQHDQEPPKCLLCEKTFALNCLLGVHIREAHGKAGVAKHEEETVLLVDDYSFPELHIPESPPATPPAAAASASAAAATPPPSSRAQSSDEEDDSMPPDPPAAVNIAKYHCDFCEYDTNDIVVFDKHMMTTHGDEVAQDHRSVHPAPANEEAVAEEAEQQSADIPVVAAAALALPEQENRPYKCQYCPYSAQAAKSLWAHNKNHERFRTTSGWKCAYCEFMSDNRHPIMVHQQRFHGGQDKDLYFLERHEDGDRIHHRSINGQAVEESSDGGAPAKLQLGTRQATGKLMPESVQKAAKAATPVKKIDPSNFTLSSMNQFKGTLPDSDIFSEPANCPVCQYCSKIRFNLIRHVKQHIKSSVTSPPATIIADDEEKAFSEDEYYDSFDDDSDHEAATPATEDLSDVCTRVSVGGTLLWQCNNCDYTRHLQSTVRRHFKQEHTDVTGRYRCPFCDFTSHSGRGMMTHCGTNHPDCPVVILFYVPEATSVHGPSVRGKVLEIEVQESSKDVSWLQKYVKRNGPRKCCNLCGHARSTYGGVMMHVLAAHFRFYPFQCAYCTKVGLEVMNIKAHIEQEHQGKPYKMMRRGKLSYDEAHQHRYVNQDLSNVLDPVPDVDKAVVVKQEWCEPATSPNLLRDSSGSPASLQSRNNSKNKGRNAPYQCKYCEYTTKWNIRDIQKHIFIVHQRKKIATCNVCHFGYNGTHADDKMYEHFALEHSGVTSNWTDHTKEMAFKIVPVDEKDGCFIVAATGEKGEVLECVPNPENVTKRRFSPVSPISVPVPLLKRPRLNSDSAGSQSESRSEPECPVDLTQVAVRGRYLAKVREATKDNKRLYGCYECMEVFDRKDKVIYHLQAKLGIKPYQCPVCEDVFTSNSLARVHAKEKHDNDEESVVLQEKVEVLQSKVFTFHSDMLPARVPIKEGGFWTVSKAKLNRSMVAMKAPIARKSTAKPQHFQVSDNTDPPFRRQNLLKWNSKHGRKMNYSVEDTSSDPRAKIINWPPITPEVNGKWMCNYCDYVTEKKNIITHVRRHTTWRTYSCHHCKIGLLSRTKMQQHILCKHAGKDPNDFTTNSEPSVYYLNKITLNILYEKRSDVPCSSESTSPRVAAVPAKKAITPTPMQHDSCRRISLMQYGEPPTSDPRAVFEVIPEPQRILGPPDLLKCNFCDFSRPNMMTVTKHQQTHFSWRPLACSHCPFQTFNPRHMSEHQENLHFKRQPGPRNIPEPAIHTFNRATCLKHGIPVLDATPSATVSTPPASDQPMDQSDSPVPVALTSNVHASLETPTNLPLVNSLNVRNEIVQSPPLSGGLDKAGPDSVCDPRAVVKVVPKAVKIQDDPLLFKCNYCQYNRPSAANVNYHQKQHFTYRSLQCHVCSYKTSHLSVMSEHYTSVHKAIPIDPIQKPAPEVFYLNRATCQRLGYMGKSENVQVATVPDRGTRRVEGDDDPHYALKTIPAPKDGTNRQYLCNFCSKAGTRVALMLHQKYHFTYRRFHCKLCTFKAMLLGKLRLHMAEKHAAHRDAYTVIPEPSVYYFTFAARALLGDKVQEFVGEVAPTCPRCKKTFEDKEEILGHLAKEHPECVQFECEYCNRKLYTKNDLNAHHIELHGHCLPDYKVVSLPDLDKGSQPCAVCNVAIPNSFPMHIHLADLHADRVNIICSHCTQVCPDKGQLRLHHTDNHPGEPLMYNVTLKDLNLEDVKPQPMTFESANMEEKPMSPVSVCHNCPVCNERQKNEIDLDLHLVDKHPEHVLYMCGHCGGLCSTKQSMQQHSAEKHPIKRPDYSVVRNVRKELLGVEQNQSPNMQSGEQYMTEQFCLPCKTLTGKELRDHVMDIHLQYCPYLCCYCSFKASSVHSIKSHHTEHHNNEELKVNQRIEPSMEQKVADKIRDIEAQVLRNQSDGNAEDSGAVSSSDNQRASPVIHRGKVSGVASCVLSTSDGFKCRLCPYSSGTRKKVYNHAWYKHKREVQADAAPVRKVAPLKIDVPRLVVAPNLLFPKKEVKAKWQCGHCDQIFHARFALRRHSYKAHPGKPPQMKPYSRTWVKPSERLDLPRSPPPLTAHRSSIESSCSDKELDSGRLSAQAWKPGPKCSKYQNQTVLKLNCHLCNFKSKEKRDLLLHVDLHQTKQGTVLRCNMCSYTTKKASEFDTHRAVHTLVRPYKCAYCDFSQFVRGQVKTHCIASHPGQPLHVLDNHTPMPAPTVTHVNTEPKVMVKDVLHMTQLGLEFLLERNSAAKFGCMFVQDGFMYRIDVNLNREDEGTF